MAFSDDAVRAKLSALNESQDSIVSTSQWVMFYRRYADRAAQLWLERLKESNTSKKLNLIYLANEIMQQAKVRKKDDFLVAFMPIIAEATATAYKGATQEVQQKIRRVVEVWRQRAILDVGIQNATEARVDDIDKSRSARSTGGRLGGSLFGSSSVPPELQILATQHAALSKVETAARPVVTKANTDYAEQTNPAALVPSAPVQAGRLSSLMKSLASAESAVNDSMKARQELIGELEKLLQGHKSKLTEEETTKQDLSTRRASIEAKRKEVEDIIFRRVSAEDANGGRGLDSPQDAGRDAAGTNGAGSHSPDMEGFTPPPPEVESFTPTVSPNLAPQPQTAAAGQEMDPLEVDTYAADPVQEQQPTHDEPPPAFEPPPAMPNKQAQNGGYTGPGMDLLSSLSLPSVRPAADSPDGAALDPRKRRKMSHKSADLEEQMFATGEGIGLDDDIAAQLGAQ